MKWKQRVIIFDRYIDDSMGGYTRINNVSSIKHNIELTGTKDVFTVQYIEEDDNNRKKIFEGDILQVDLNKSVIHGYVYYSPAISCYTLKYKKFMTPIHEIHHLSQWGAKWIIGNVFQNPELVEKYKLKLK